MSINASIGPIPTHLILRSISFFFTHIHFPASGHAVVTGVVPSSPRFLPSVFIAHRVQQSHCSSIFHRVLLSHALALSASQFVLKKKSPQIYASMPSGGLELTKLTYTRLEDNLIRHRGDRMIGTHESTGPACHHHSLLTPPLPLKLSTVGCPWMVLSVTATGAYAWCVAMINNPQQQY